MALVPIDLSLAKQLALLMLANPYKSIDDLVADIKNTVPRANPFDRSIVERFIEHADDPTKPRECRDASQAIIRQFVKKKLGVLALHEHRNSWTSCVLPVLDAGLPTASLHASGMNAGHFKQKLVDAINGHRELPPAAQFINNTGQWLKPVLRALLRHPISIQAYICDPALTASAGARDPYQTLGILEFLWSLPTSLRLDKDSDLDRHAKLEIWTFDGSHGPVNRLACFDATLIAFSTTNYLDHLECMTGHPACEGKVRCIQGLSAADVWIRGHPDFERAMERAQGRIDALPAAKHRITWTIKGFKFHDGYDKDIEPRRFFRQ